MIPIDLTMSGSLRKINSWTEFTAFTKTLQDKLGKKTNVGEQKEEEVDWIGEDMEFQSQKTIRDVNGVKERDVRRMG